MCLLAGLHVAGGVSIWISLKELKCDLYFTANTKLDKKCNTMVSYHNKGKSNTSFVLMFILIWDVLLCVWYLCVNCILWML